MPTIKDKGTVEVRYTREEISELIRQDMLKRSNMVDEDHEIVSIVEYKVKTGEVPRGPFDSDPVYGFAGVDVTFEKTGQYTSGK